MGRVRVTEDQCVLLAWLADNEWSSPDQMRAAFASIWGDDKRLQSAFRSLKRRNLASVYTNDEDGERSRQVAIMVDWATEQDPDPRYEITRWMVGEGRKLMAAHEPQPAPVDEAPKVWVVLHEDEAVRSLDSVFDTEAKAEAYALQQNLEEAESRGVEWEPDDDDFGGEGMIPYTVHEAVLQ